MYCHKCETEVADNNYDKHFSGCKVCRQKYSVDYRKKNKAKLKQKSAEYRERIKQEKQQLTQTELKKVLHYSPCTGILKWENPLSRRVKTGDEISTVNAKGYIVTTIKGVKYLAHRIVWLYVYGKFPDNQIDHINHIKTDNRIENLRDVTNNENHKNIKLSSSNTSGVCGVHYNKRAKLYMAYIGVNSKAIPLGYFKEKQNAIIARKNAEVKYGYHENTGKEYATKKT